MLILTRKIGEKIIIDGDIEVMVLGVKGNQVRMGINAPQQVTVHREEIQKKIEEDKLNIPKPCVIHSKNRRILRLHSAG